MKLLKKGESGQALILALAMLALGSLIIVPTLNLASTNLKYNQLIERETFEAYSADSGVDYGLCEVYNNPVAYQETPLQESFVMNNRTVNVTVEYMPVMGAYKITSTATSASDRSTTIESYIIIDVGLFGNAFACDGNLSISQTQLTGDASCDVFANGNISLMQSTVDGDVTAAGTVTKTQSTVTGEINQHVPTVEFPVIDPQPHIDAALEGGTCGSISWTFKNQTLGPKYINGNLTITGSDVELQGTVYVTGHVEISMASEITGFGDIVAAGYIRMSQSGFVVDNPDTLPLVMSLNSYINLTQMLGYLGGIQAVLYAPNGTITLIQSNVYGAVAADSISVSQSQIFYPATLKGRADLPGAGLKSISYGYK